MNNQVISASHHHGGQLQSASAEYDIPLDNWLDLSTGISPFVYPLPPVPEHCWQRLPESNDGLMDVANAYYGSDHVLPVSGSQEAIQSLPSLFVKSENLVGREKKQQRVGILEPAYHSHRQAWEQAGLHVITLSVSEIEQQIPNLNVLILVNPSNPTTQFFSVKTVLEWHHKLTENKGWMIVDEAFIDATPDMSLIQTKPVKGLIVLRSIGKFFGLAGIRLGFVWAEADILNQLANKQDDWSVSHPARWAGRLALHDVKWHQLQRQRLPTLAQRLEHLLEEKIFTKPLVSGGVYFNTPQVHVQHTALFAYFLHPRAKQIHQHLAQQGILTRLFETPLALRFGLPKTEEEWQRLEKALDSI